MAAGPQVARRQLSAAHAAPETAAETFATCVATASIIDIC